ncbi:MAG: hypothetical protein JJU12_03455 [Chlamydiales bacterium]|nr:hypothetical protein [Chlamydiales bacterium]
MNPTEEAISKYYEIFRKGIDTGVMHVEQLPFDDDVRILTPTFKMAGKEEVFALYLESINTIKNLEVKELFISSHTACGIVEFTLFNDPAPVLTADWFHLKEGKIAKIHFIYDSAAWEKVIQI